MAWPNNYSEDLSRGVDYFASDNNMPVRIVYPNSDGTTGGATYNYKAPNQSSNDPYGGVPLNINVGNSAEGLNSLSATLGSGFSDLFNLIQKNTDKNNAWSAAQAQKQMDFQERMNQVAMDFNSLEAAKNRDWQQMMSNTAHQREIADLKAAGLNPVLSASGGNGAAVTSGATASGVTSAGAKGDTDTSGNSALTAIYGALISAQTQMYNANLSAQTNLAIADKQAAASMYGAQMAAETARYNNPWQIMTQFADMIGGDSSGNRGSGFGNLVRQGNEAAQNVVNRVGNALLGTKSNQSTLGKFIGYLLGKGAGGVNG